MMFIDLPRMFKSMKYVNHVHEELVDINEEITGQFTEVRNILVKGPLV